MKQPLKERRKSALEYVSDKTVEIAGKRWPKYVVEDMLYTIFKDDPEPFGEWVRQFIGDNPNREWKLIELDITEDIFDDKTREQLETREGGESNPNDVPNDEERHCVQAELLEKNGIPQEPIIVIEDSDGKYELLEGWHRTIQGLVKFPCYKQKAWVYKSQNVDNTDDEEFELDYCDKCMQMKNHKNGVCQKCNVEQIEEDVEPEDVDIQSFEAKQELTQEVYDDKKIKSEIRKNLLKICDDFYESLEIPKVDIDDIVLTGSLANYNWSDYSDVDLHILIDIADVDDNKLFAKDYLDSKRALWNEKHDITMAGFEVEIYMQDTHEVHHSTGVYSILRDEWVVEPKQFDGEFDRTTVKKKSSDLMNRIERLESELVNGDYITLIGKIEKLREKIKKMRSAGLSGKGEFSTENIVFKVLRRTEYMGRLLDLQTKAYDLSLSI
jgi:predicted nucleotidyltransferase